MAGRYELMKENQSPSERPETDYWNECFTWEELKKIIPYLRSQKWKLEIIPVEKEEVCGRMHIFSFTYGINHDFRIISISGLHVIVARDFGMRKTIVESTKPIGY